MLLEILIIVSILILLFYMHYLIRKNDINFNYIFLNYFVLILFIVIILLLMNPFIARYINEKTGFIPRDLLFCIAIGYLFYASFIQSIIIANQSSKINRIAIDFSIKEAISKNDIPKEGEK